MLRWLIPALLTLYAGCPYPVGSPAIPRSEAQIAARVPLVTSLPSAFPFGVASGDPLPDAVILWTMLDTAAWRSDSMVYWAVATDRSFQDTIISGQTIARRGRGCRVKVDATGLIPDRSYFYRFRRGEEYSEVGRTRTAPARGTKPTVNLAVVSCNALEWGYFNAYEALAERADLQAIVHLGDYIYEYASGVYGDTTLGRIHEPYHETVTAADYHARYAQYRRDPQLRAAHRVHPFICVWDDHEVANNSHRTGAENHTDTLEGDYLKRLTAAKQIYYDWMPIREQADGAIYRRFRFGDLAELHMLDERLAGRDAPATDFEPAHLADTNRHMLGEAQFDWLCTGLRTSDARWQLLGNQVLFAPLDLSDILPAYAVNLDAWDGYAYEQARLMDSLRTYENPNTVVLTGDTHCSWYFDVPGPDGERLAHELATPSVSSANYDEFIAGWDTLTVARYRLYRDNDHLHYTNIKDHGYLLLTLEADAATATFHYSRTIRSRDPRGGRTKTFHLPYVDHRHAR